MKKYLFLIAILTILSTGFSQAVYEGLKKTFNPVNFNPEKWAKAAKKAGMKYVVFTTKHHDGFCMFDSKWMEINDEGIYNSKVLSPYKEDNICMTQQANGNVYFFYLCEENETVMPSEIFFKSHRPVKGATVKLLGYKSPLKWEKIEEGFMVTIPEKIRNKPPSDYVWTIKVSQIEHR